MAYLDTWDFYSPRSPKWNPEDGWNQNMGTTRLFFSRRITCSLERAYEYDPPIDTDENFKMWE